MLQIEFWDAAFRLLLAGALGAAIGVEREYRSKEAGYRTHFLVALGSALIMVVSQYGFTEFSGVKGYQLDPARIAAQVVSGIGFIGAGTIIFQRPVVRGLTTAAGIWTTCGIGLAVGTGLYLLGIVATVLTLVGLEALTLAFSSIGLHSTIVEFSTTDKEALKRVSVASLKETCRVVSYEMDEEERKNGTLYKVRMVIRVRNTREERAFLLKLAEDDAFIVKSMT